MIFIVSKTKDEAKTKIEQECCNLYENKLKVFEKYENLKLEENDKQKKKKDEQIKFKFNDSPTNNLSQCYVYITNFLFSLRNDQELMFKIIQKAKVEDAENSLSSLIINNFYENILSPSYIEDELLALIERGLRYEINNLKLSNQPQVFLKDSVIGNILKGLIMKNDVKSYFNMIFKGVIDKMENKSNDNSFWNFDVSLIGELVAKLKKEMEKNNKNTKNKNSVELKKNNSLNMSFDNTIDLRTYKQNADKEKEESDFLSKYIPDLTKRELITIMQNQKNPDMKDYILKQITEFGNDDNLFANSNFLTQVYQSQEPSKVLSLYQKDFISCADIIQELFNILNQNMHLVPFSVKCICKIISLLIQQKFININKVELNAFIGQFFFEILFSTIFKKPDYNALITSFIISMRTRKNIDIICHIIQQLISGQLFKGELEPSYTPFNWFFILDIMPSAFEFFDKITNVILPPYIEKIINDPDNDNYYYDYFEENKSEFVLHKSICFSINDINVLLNIVINNKEFFTQKPIIIGLNEEIANQKINDRRIFGMTISKLEIKTHFETISNHFNLEKKMKQKNYFLKMDIKYNEHFSDLMNITHKSSQPNLTIPEIKDIKTDEDFINNNLIKIQNFICKLLYNYRILNKSDFTEGTTTNTINILNELSKFLKTGSFVIDNSIPSEWYVNSLLKLLKNVPDEYKIDDYEKIYEKLTKDLNDSIKTLDFEELSRIFERLKYTERSLQNIRLNLNAIDDLETNNLINEFVENHPLEVSVNLNLTQKKFSIEKSNTGFDNKLSYLDDYLFDEGKKKKKGIIYKNIYDFTNRFPPLIYFQEKQGLDLFEFESELNLPEKLEYYFKLVKDAIYKSKIFNQIKNKEQIYYKITSYIMSKIYDKIFPNEPDPDDIKIYHNSVRLSWIEPNDLIANNNYTFDNFLPETKELLLKLDNEKSPIGKMDCLINLSYKIKNIIQFNNGNDIVGVDDSLPIFQYAVIKAQPNKFSSNFKYMNMYMNKEMKNGPRDHLVSQINVIGEFIKNITYEQLNGISEDIFNKKCNEATSSDLSNDTKK